MWISRRRELRLPNTQSPADRRPLWSWGLSEAMRAFQREDPERYGDGAEKGGTIANTWHHLFAISQAANVCVLTEGHPYPGTEGIPTVVTLPAAQVIQRLRTILRTDRQSAVGFIHDGRSGHTVTLLHADEDRFVYSDPWPGDSLLCEHQNTAGIAAREHGNDWSVTSAELARVLVGALVWPSAWAEVCGEPGALRYPEVASSGLWASAFLRETLRTRDEYGFTRIEAAPMGQSRNVHITLSLGEDERVRDATLRLRAAAATGGDWDPEDSEPGLNPSALELTRVFGWNLTPVTDRDEVTEVLHGLDLAWLHDRFRDPAFPDSPQGQLLRTYIGDQPDVSYTFSMSALDVSRTDDDILITVRTH